MRVMFVPSSTPRHPQMFTSYLVDGVVAIDAGCLDQVGDLAVMSAVKHVFLTHSHLDHIASLPPFLDAVYDGSGDCVTIHGHAHTLECLRKDIFNNRIYPDFLHISTFRPPYLKLNELKAGQVVEACGLRVTPVEVNHVVPSFGYVVDDGKSATVFPADTGPTDEIWKVAARIPHLKAVFLECTFPGSMQWLAEIARHLTPALYAQEIQKLGRPMRYITIHLHPRHKPLVVDELMAMKLPGVEIGEPGATYEL